MAKEKIIQFIRNVFKGFGLDISRYDPQKLNTLEAIKRSIKRGLDVKTIIDVGASDGRWSKPLVPLFPRSHFHLLEAQQPHEEGLKTFIKGHNATYTIAAVAEKVGEVHFDNRLLFGGLAGKSSFGRHSIKVKSTTIDHEVEKLNLKGPFLLKLDTHGYEIPIFEGAEQTLKNAELIVVEVYNHIVGPESVLFYELCTYLDAKGFRPVEMVDLLLRPRDQSLWQMDIHFARKDAPFFGSTEFE